MVNITGRFPALHPHCISVDLKALAKPLRWFCQQNTKKLFQSIPRLNTRFSFLAPLYHQRKWRSLAGVLLAGMCD